MKRPLVLRMLGAMLLCASMTVGAAAPSNEEADKNAIEIEASFWQVHGDSWSLHITRSGQSYLEHRSSKNYAHTQSRFLLYPEDVSKLATEGPLKGFEKLPRKMSADVVPMHWPDYTITVRTREGMHSVHVYAPDENKQQAELKQFAQAWNTIWALAPLRPKELSFEPSAISDKPKVAPQKVETPPSPAAKD